jgi:hypothetical protein
MRSQPTPGTCILKCKSGVLISDACAAARKSKIPLYQSWTPLESRNRPLSADEHPARLRLAMDNGAPPYATDATLHQSKGGDRLHLGLCRLYHRYSNCMTLDLGITLTQRASGFHTSRDASLGSLSSLHALRILPDKQANTCDDYSLV